MLRVVEIAWPGMTLQRPGSAKRIVGKSERGRKGFEHD